MTWTSELPADACEEAVEWAETQPSFAKAWRACKRGDWMLWYLGRAGIPKEELVLLACACARLSLKHVPDGEDRPRIAIETAEAWAHGEGVALWRVRIAADAAAAAAAADAAAAASSSVSAAAAASAAYAAVDAADDAAAATTYAASVSAAYAAAHAADDAADDAAAATAAARKDTLAECATIVRRRYPTIKSVRAER